MIGNMCIANAQAINRLQYIRSDGTPYINTGVSGVYKATFEVAFGSSSGRTLMGQGQEAGLYFGKDASNRPELGGSIYINADFTQQTTAIFERTSSAAILTVGNSTVQRAGSTYDSPFYIFRINDAAWATYAGVITLYSAKFENADGVLIRSYSPAKDADGIVCLYEGVSGEYVYGSGSGQFTAGPEI